MIVLLWWLGRRCRGGGLCPPLVPEWNLLNVVEEPDISDIERGSRYSFEDFFSDHAFDKE